MKLCTRKIRKAVITVAVLTSLLLIPFFDVYAGDINSAEAGLIAIASGTFEYDGKTYKAYASYVYQLTSYLSGDAVDLSQEKANEAAAYIFGNVAEGLSRGYIYEIVEDTEEETEEDTEVNTEASTEATTETEKKDSSNTVKVTTKDGQIIEIETKGGKKPDEDLSKTLEDLEESVSKKSSIKHRPDKDKSDITITMGDDMTITSGDDTVVVTSEDRIVPNGMTRAFMIFAFVVLAVTLMSSVILITTKCMRFKSKDHQKPKRGHRRRRKIRKTNRIILTVTNAFAITGLLFIVGSYISLFNHNKIQQSIQDSGYYKYAYSQYVGDVGNIESDGSDNEIMPYEDFMVLERQATDNILSGKEVDSSYKTTDINIAPYIMNFRRDVMPAFNISLVVYIVAIIISSIMTIYMDQRRDRGIKSIAISELIGTAVLVVATVILMSSNLTSKLFIEPDYLYEFFNYYFSWTTKVLTVMSIFGVVIGMALIGLYKSKNKSR